MILAFAMQAAIAVIPGFAGIQPAAEERLALPHIADAVRATDAAARRRSLDAALALLPAETRFRGAFQCMRGDMLMWADRVVNRTEGLSALDECYRMLPGVPMAQRAQAEATFLRDDYRGGAALLAKAVAADGRLARGLGDERLDAIFRRLGYQQAFAERRALALALARTGLARNDPARLSGWLRDSVLERVQKGDLRGAGALLPYIVDPSDGIAMLIDRRYEPLWPALESWAGGDLEAQRQAFVAAARAGYDGDPTLGHAREAATALERSGYAEEGLALLERAVTAFGAPRDDYAYARAVVRLAKLRAQAGERDPERVLAPMTAALAGGVSGPYLINVVPNLALGQVALGQPAAALATLDRYPTTPDKVETRAAYGYFVAIRGCALAKLGRDAEARAAFAEVAKDYAANRGAVDLATGCGGSDDAVLAGWTKAIDDPDTRSGALMAMTLATGGAAGDPLSPTEGRLRAVAARPEVVERLRRYGRALPAGYAPALRRMGG